MTGDVPGNQHTNIDFAFLPLTYSTAEAEISIRTTEFDSQPKLIRIVGSSAPFTGVPTDINKEQTETKTLLTSGKSYNPTNQRSTKLKKINEKPVITENINTTAIQLSKTKMSKEE